MTKKDYELIAYCLFTINYWGNTYTGEEASKTQIADRKMIIDRLANWFADNLQTKNTRFDRQKFLIACGVENEKPIICLQCNKTGHSFCNKD